MLDFAALTSQPASSLEQAGQIFVIQCEPDPFTGERINVGVCAIDPSGRRFVKTLTEAGRLECLYGESGSAVVLSLAQVAGACAIKGLASPSSQILFSEPVPFYNSDVTAMLESTFADQITVAIPRRVDAGKQNIDDATALKSVIDRIKKVLNLDAGFVANTPQVIIDTNRGPRPVMIPLQPIGGAGVIRSAYYSPATLKSHLMDSVLDLDCVSRYRGKKRLGLFILRPSDASQKDSAAIDAVIDSVAFRAPGGLHLGVATDIDGLAQEVTEWALAEGTN